LAFFRESVGGGFAEKSAERAIRANDPVAWHLGREGVYPKGLPDRMG
jgi:hypothetical protein